MTAQTLERPAIRLRPVEYVQLFGPPAARCSGCNHKPDEHAAGGRLDQLVLADIAQWASWSRETWGEGTWPSVPMIGRRIGYCDRSVQYSLRRLERSGFVERVERPGFSSVFRIVRVVEPVDEAAAVVDLAVHKRRRSRRSNTPPLHRRGATVAPELGHLPTPIPPDPPVGGLDEVDGAVAPAQPAPQWRREAPSETSATDPPSLADHRARAHREDARRRRPSATPEPSLADVDAVRQVVAGALAGPVEGDPLPQRWSRRVTRLQPCPRCGARAGDACRNRAGRLRKSNHAERRTPPPPRLG